MARKHHLAVGNMPGASRVKSEKRKDQSCEIERNIEDTGQEKHEVRAVVAVTAMGPWTRQMQKAKDTANKTHNPTHSLPKRPAPDESSVTQKSLVEVGAVSNCSGFPHSNNLTEHNIQTLSYIDNRDQRDEHKGTTSKPGLLTDSKLREHHTESRAYPLDSSTYMTPSPTSDEDHKKVETCAGRPMNPRTHICNDHRRRNEESVSASTQKKARTMQDKVISTTQYSSGLSPSSEAATWSRKRLQSLVYETLANESYNIGNILLYLKDEARGRDPLMTAIPVKDRATRKTSVDTHQRKTEMTMEADLRKSFFAPKDGLEVKSTRGINASSTLWKTAFMVTHTLHRLVQHLLILLCSILQTIWKNPRIQLIIITSIASNMFCLLIPAPIKHLTPCMMGSENAMCSVRFISAFFTVCSRTQTGNHSYEEEVLMKIANLTDNWAQTVADGDSSVAIFTALEKASTAASVLRVDVEHNHLKSKETLDPELAAFEDRFREVIWAMYDFNRARNTVFERVYRIIRRFNTKLQLFITIYAKRSFLRKVWDRLVFDSSSSDLVQSVSNTASNILDETANLIQKRVLRPADRLMLELADLYDLQTELAHTYDVKYAFEAANSEQIEISESRWSRFWFPRQTHLTKAIAEFNLKQEFQNSSITSYILAQNNLIHAMSIYNTLLTDIGSLIKSLDRYRNVTSIDIVTVTNKHATIAEALSRLETLRVEEWKKQDRVIARIKDKGEPSINIPDT